MASDTRHVGELEVRVLVTGNKGLIGRFVESVLGDAGHEVVGFDLRGGDDIRDNIAVSRAAGGCEAIVHLAALLPYGVDESDLVNVNLLGTWNILLAAKKHDIDRIVFFSSVNALGVFMGNRKPDYLPIDDEHRCYPRSSYSISKRLAEKMCRFHAEETGAVTVCLRPPWVLAPSDYQTIKARWKKDAESEWQPFWEYGAFLDVRDAASAAMAALALPESGYTAALLCADDILSMRPSIEMADMLLPGVPFKDTARYDIDPYCSLVTAARAKKLLHWQPVYRWRDQVEA